MENGLIKNIPRELEDKILRMQDRITELEETLRAIRSGEVDALIVPDGIGKRIFTLKGADHGYQEIVEGMTEGAVTVAKDHTILYCNNAFASMTGRPAREIIGADVSIFFKSDDGLRLSAMIEKTKTDRIEGELTLKSQMTQGRPVLASMTKVGIGDIETTCLVVTDLTLSKQAEEAERREQELTRSNQELEQFAYVSSHDLQEPLRKVSAYADLLMTKFSADLGEEGKKYIGNIFHGARRMQNLIRDLLDYSRLSSNETKKETVSLKEIVSDVCDDLEIVIKEKKAEIRAGNLPSVVGDSARLHQVFQNLISNAIKFHGSLPPRVQITSAKEENEWIISVKDNGIGIDPKNFEQIFKVFHRLHGKINYEGTGIGLAICKKVVEQHSGRLWVSSRLGKGSTFHFSLPIR